MTSMFPTVLKLVESATVEPRFNEPLYDVLDMTNDVLKTNNKLMTLCKL